MSQSAPLGGDPVLNAAFYVVTRPAPVLNAAGGRDWIPVGVYLLANDAANAAARIPGAAIMLNVCISITPAAVAAAAARAG